MRRTGPVPSWVQRSALLPVFTCLPTPPPDWLTPSHPLRTSYNSPNAFAAFKRCFCCHGDLLAFKSHSESNPSAEGEAKSVGEESAWAWVWAEPPRPPTCQQTPVPSPRCRPGPEMFFSGSGMKAFLTAEERSATSGSPPRLSDVRVSDNNTEKERTFATREQPSRLPLFLFGIFIIGDHEKVRYYNREQMELMR